jgi:hypothetical protein
MAFIPIAAGHTHGKREKTALQLLRDRRALRRESAQPLTDLSRSQRRSVERLVERGVVRKAAGDRYYIDGDALSDYRGRQLAIGFGFLVIAAGVAAGLALI